MRPFHTTLRVTTPPASEPITLTQAKKYARIYTDYEDDIVASLITTARILAEQYLCRSLISQTLQWTVKPVTENVGVSSISRVSFWAGTGLSTTLELPRAPVQSVSQVSVADFNGNTVAIDSTAYTLDTTLEPARMCIYWQALTVQPVYPIQHITVNFLAGYSDPTTIPTPIIQSILILLNFLYERRGDEVETPDFPKAAYALLDLYRIGFFGGTP